jgi:hypothetical protein
LENNNNKNYKNLKKIYLENNRFLLDLIDFLKNFLEKNQTGIILTEISKFPKNIKGLKNVIEKKFGIHDTNNILLDDTFQKLTIYETLNYFNNFSYKQQPGKKINFYLF